jgi:hypothetical protein
MNRPILRRTSFIKHRRSEKLCPQNFLPAASMLVGITAAVAVMSRTPEDTIRGFGDAIVLSGTRASVLSAYWKCSRYHIFTALLSTSYLGVAGIPLLLAYRGFTLCCTSAALMLDYSASGAMLSAIILGLPGLVALPCLLILASESIRTSAQLFTMRFGLGQRYPPRFSVRRVCLCFVFLIPVAVIEQQVLPKLITMLT